MIKSILKHFIIKIYTYSIRINLYIVSGFILSLLTKPLSRKRKYRILCLAKPIFNDDLNAVNKFTSQLQFLLFPRLLLSEVIRKYVKNFDALNDSTYYTELEGTAERELIFSYMLRLIKWLQFFIDFDAVFAGNYVYVSNQELFRVCNHLEIPVVILYKEGIFPLKKYSTLDINLYSNRKFYGDIILFYNNAIRKLLLSASIPGIKENNTYSVGIPRFDQYFNHSTILKKDMKIILFSFNPITKSINYGITDSQLESFIEKSEDFHKIFIDFAVEHPDWELVIKTKKAPDDYNYVKNIKAQYTFLPNNIKFTSEGDVFELVQRSMVVAGFTSTTLLEGYASSCIVVMPDFQSFIPSEETNFFLGDEKRTFVINEKKELHAICNSHYTHLKLSEDEKRTVLFPLVYKTDGKSSKRVEKKIVSTIEKNKIAN